MKDKISRSDVPHHEKGRWYAPHLRSIVSVTEERATDNRDAMTTQKLILNNTARGAEESSGPRDGPCRGS